MIALAKTCAGCGHSVLFHTGTCMYDCGCMRFSEEDLVQNGVPAAWLPHVGAAIDQFHRTLGSGLPNSWFASTPAQPQDPSKCTKCGKDLDFVGLNKTYPPKRDDMGRAICPHCAAVQPEPRGL
jgi:hypothetical protein